jgi:hypothetical protein
LPPLVILITLILHILLENLVNLPSVVFIAPVLDSVIAVSEIVPLATVQEIEPGRKIAQDIETGAIQQRYRAAIVGPIQVRGLTLAFGLEELRQGGVEDESVGLTFGAALRVSSLEWKRE